MAVTLTHLTGGGMQMLVSITEEQIREITFQTMCDLNKKVAEKLASDIYKKNKKKIISAIDIDIITAEIQKIITEKIKTSIKTSE